MSDEVWLHCSVCERPVGYLTSETTGSRRGVVVFDHHVHSVRAEARLAALASREAESKVTGDE